MGYYPSATSLNGVMAVNFLNYLEEIDVYEPGGEATKAHLRQIFFDKYRPKNRSKYQLGNWSFGLTLCVLLRAKFIHRSKPQTPDTVTFTNKNIHLQPSGSSGNAAPLTTEFRRRGRQSVDQFITRNRTQAEHQPPGPAQPASKTASSSPADPPQADKYCGLCEKNMDSEKNRQEHLKSRGHRVQVILLEIKTTRPHLMEDKEGVKVTSSHDHSTGQYIEVEIEEGDSNIPEVKILIQNEEPDVRLINCELLKRTKSFTLDDPHKVSDRKCTLRIPTGAKYTVTMTIDFSKYRRFPGRQSNILVLTFTKSGRTFHVIRDVKVITLNETIRLLAPTAPYKAPPRVTLKGRDPSVEQVEGIPMPSFGRSELETVVELNNYKIPDTLRSLVNAGLKDGAEDIWDLLKADLTFANYQEKFSLLMHIEELQMEVDIRKYDMEDATMKPCGKNRKLLSLKVTGLAENRPSILKGDHLFVRKLGADKKPQDTEYKGYVHEVWQDEVHLGFSDKLGFMAGMRFSVRFTFNRLPAKMAHRALELCVTHDLHDVLFPSIPSSQPVDTNLRLFDRKLESNQEQVRAVQHMVAGTSRPAPYLLFGPPGTGKTVTVVEAIKQIVRRDADARVLASAPSNSAADVLAERLREHLDQREIFRMYGMSRPFELMPSDIADISNYDDACHAYLPCKEDLEPYNVIVCTIVTAGRLASADFPPDHFTHVVIDEAGHAIEPEALIPVAGVMAREGGQVILAGDPQQLGPVLRSPWASKHGLSLSFLGRLMTHCNAYKRLPDCGSAIEAYDPRLITKLVRNYRSHPAILKVPNEQFYHNELQAHADQLQRESMCRWEMLPKKMFPIIFHGVNGLDQREARSPSFFNPQEADQVLQYVKALLDARGGGINVQPKNIGVITPYRKQVEKIRTVLRSARMLKEYPGIKDIKVGSVEEFQGQERKVIIISTVRSSPQFLTVDADFKLGFLTNPKRFNVALTRAKALLLVTGNPRLLARDTHWNIFLSYCQENGGYTDNGCDFEETTEKEVADMEQIMSTVKTDSTGDVGEGGLQINPGDPEWRSDD